MKDMELEEMRAQINLLKEMLDKQSIVNNRLLQQSMKAKVSQIHRQGWKGMACGIIAIVLNTLLYFVDALSLPVFIITILFMLFAILGTWYSHKPLNEKDLLGNDIHTTANAFSLVKKRYKFWMHYITPVSIILWLPLYCRDYVNSLGLPQEAAKYTIMALLISACIGALIGYLWHRKVVNTCDEAVKQLEED